jgi:hypothetical protein
MIRLRHSLLVVPLIVLTGCNRGPNLVEVEGTVTLRGQPFPGVIVSFNPDAEAGTPGPRSTAWTDETGHYRLTCDRPAKPGAVAGKHRVTVLDPEAFYDPSATEQKPWKYDMKYIQMSQTPLRAEVQTPGPQTIDLNID